MALYDVEILNSPRSSRALKLISTLSGIGERDVKTRLQFPPLRVRQSLPLSEAVDVERQLQRLGIKTRLVKVREDAEKSGEPGITPEPSVPQSEDVIEIPEEEIRVLDPFQQSEQDFTFERKKMTLKPGWKTWWIFPIVFGLVALVSIYVIFQTNRHRTQEEVILYMEQWHTTLAQQDRLLDKDFQPERIFFKLDELEGKIERLLQLVKPFGKATELRSEFSRIKTESYPLIRDLAFRRSLEEQGYPIHPTCMIDRGMVRGSSDLPESTLLRILLLGQNKAESVYYAARVSGGTFKLIIDPTVERNVYDAKATVASLSQQPEEIQRWAERKFLLSKICASYLPRTRSITATPVTSSRTALQSRVSAESSDSGVGLLKADMPLLDPGSDPERARQLGVILAKWEETILSSQQHDLIEEPQILEKIYRRLLDLENRIDQLIGLLESSSEHNSWIEKRENVYGSFIGLRQQLADAQSSHRKGKDPFEMESSIRRRLKEKGFTGVDVLVVDSPQASGTFVIEIEMNEGKKEDVLSGLAQTLIHDLQEFDLAIDRVSLRYKGRTMWWAPDQILKAAEVLQESDGRARCATQLELTATSNSLQ